MSDETRNEGEQKAGDLLDKQGEPIKVHLDTEKDYIVRSIGDVGYTVKGQLIISAHTQNLVNLIIHPRPNALTDFNEAMLPTLEVSEHSTGKRLFSGTRGEDASSVAVQGVKAARKLVNDMGGVDAFHERLAYQAKSNEPIPFEEVFPY